MMPRLLAEESMRAAERLAVGTGSLKRDDASRIIRRWRRERQPAGQRATPAPVHVLAAIGIQVRKVPKKGVEARG